MPNASAAPSLCAAYADRFPIGAAVTPRMLADPAYRELILRHFSSITAENDMKPERLMDREATLRLGDPIRTVQNYETADRMLAFARDNGIRVRFHTLCWHNQTPRWFFTEGWSQEPDAPLADADTMLRRLAAYIADVMDHVNTAFPGVVYAWDVVNEAIEPDHGGPDLLRTKSLWFQTCGGSFIASAFAAARAHQAQGQLLIYNDFNTFQPVKAEALRKLLKGLKDQGLVDGIGMQAHLVLEGFDVTPCETAARAYAAMGLTLQATEMDVHCKGDDPESQAALARAYGDYFGMLLRLQREGADVSGITLWGVTDADSWLQGFRREPSFPLLFTGDKQTKPAFDAVLQAPGAIL